MGSILIAGGASGSLSSTSSSAKALDEPWCLAVNGDTRESAKLARLVCVSGSPS